MSNKALWKSVVALILVVAGSNRALGADIWVSGTGDNGTGDGSSGNPYRTISWAMQVANANDVIKIRSGTYGVADGESFPIIVKSGVDVRGQETLLANFPRIGGDVADSAVDGLFEVDATAGDRDRIELYRLYFVGEDTNGEDAPSALFVTVAGGYNTEAVMEACFVERSEMRDSGHADRACVSATVGWGECSLIVDGSVLYATERGGIEMLTGTDTTESNESAQELDVQRCQILATGTDTAGFGIRWVASGEEWLDADGSFPRVNLVSNVIDSSGASSSSYGIETGLEVAVEPAGDGSMILHQGDFFIVANVVKQCRGDGIWLRNNPDSPDAASHFVNDTIAYNSAAGYGFVIADSAANGPTQIVNCIVYGNHNGGTQYDNGGTGWDPLDHPTTTEHCDWQGLSGGCGNIDADPEFVSVTTGDFHLVDDESPCVDAGDNNPDGGVTSPGEFDIDGDDRIIDGDGDTTEKVDIGADEFEP